MRNIRIDLPWNLIFLSSFMVLTVSAQVKQPGHADQEFNAFLPNDEGKALVTKYCTRCHSTDRLRQVITEGGDERFWNGLVRQMITVWNAPIANEDIDPIVTYLVKHFGPSAEHGIGKGTVEGIQDPVPADPDEELNSFLPDDEGKALITIYCRGCHSARGIRQTLAQRAGRNKSYWNTLVRRMITVWNAPIADEDIEPIVTYLTNHFGPSWGRGAALSPR
ncbi:hypothetical protein MYX82_12380 [Acidobacteria bacterium AH-259-D05]|nr:hypothetical protein [Acidobacteria bacterium AH-259-D05]